MFQHRRVLFVLIAAAFLALGGCGEDATSPDPSQSGNRALRAFDDLKVIGPTELVVGIDVSDSISEGELAEITSALGACLADASLFPTDGSVSVSVWAYGDTIVGVVDTLTSVTPASLADTFGPALAALATDRGTTGSTAVMADLLDAAGTVLGAGAALDTQVLLFASGLADDDAAAVSSAAALVGTLVSALGIDPTPDDEMHLQSVAASGEYETVSGSVAEACQRILASLLVSELALSPEDLEAAVGDSVTVQAAVFGGGDPEEGIADLEVTLSVAGGPHAGSGATGLTDDDGVYRFGYTGTGSGIDTLIASAVQPRTGSVLADTVMVGWSVPLSCDAGGPYRVDVDADTIYVQLDGTGSGGDGELRYEWSVEIDDAEFDDYSSPTPVLMIWGDALCEENIELTLIVGNEEDLSSCYCAVILTDVREVEVVAADPVELWPPNHKFRSFSPADLLRLEGENCAAPDFDDLDIVVLEVTSNEPENATGDGNTAPDIRISCPDRVELRAERQGGGDGRVYTILYRVTMDDGSAEDIEAQVYVPHDKGSPCADLNGYSAASSAQGCDETAATGGHNPGE